MAEPSKSQQIQQAHENGTLLLHLLEFDMNKDPDHLAKFFDVLAGKPGKYVTNFAGHFVPSSPEGYLGLATTSLKKGHPVKLYYQPDHYTGIGFLMTPDAPHVDPLYVTSIDAWSGVNDNDYVVVNTVAEPHAELRKIQGLPLDGGFKMDLKSPELPEKARKALARMWELIEQKGTLDPEADLNEVCVRAHAKGVKALVIDEGPSEGPAILDDVAPPMTPEVFAERVESAKKLRAWLTERYPEDFPEPLPIFAYSKLAEHQLVELTEEQLRTGDMPDHGNILWPGAGRAALRILNRRNDTGSARDTFG